MKKVWKKQSPMPMICLLQLTFYGVFFCTLCEKKIIKEMRDRHWIDYKSIWCRDFTIICITKKLEVKIPAYTSFISDVHKSHRVEKIVLHHLIFYLSRLVSVYWFQTQFHHNCKYIRLLYGKRMWNKIAFGTN